MIPFYEQQRTAWINHQQQLDFPLHMHDAIEIVCLLEGSSTVICESGQIALGPGDIFLSFPNQIHGYEKTRDFDGYLLVASTATLTGCKAMLEQNQPAHPVVHPTGEAATHILALLQMMHKDRNNAPPPQLQGYALVLLNKVATMTGLMPRPANTGTLQAILRYINTHYHEPITRKEIARAVGYSESHISHLFARQMQVSLTDYITALRMDEARQLLRETTLPVSRIAMQLGFSSIRSFNRFFVKDMNMTPSAYRNQSKL